MNHPRLNILSLAGRKLAVTLCIVVFAAAAFATLGDGKSKSGTSRTTTLLSSKKAKAGSFSLKSGYQFRGSQIINPDSEKKYISFNTTVTWQKGNTTYVVPLKKKVVLSNVKIQLGNQQLRRL